MIEVKRIIQTNVNEIKNLVMSHTYDKETKTLFFEVLKREGQTSIRSSTQTTHPKYKYGLP